MSISGSSSIPPPRGIPSNGNGCAAMPVIPKTNGRMHWHAPVSSKQVRSTRRDLQRPQHRFGAGDVDLPRLLLDVERLDDAVVDEHRVTLRTHSKAGLGEVEFEPERTDEVAAAISQHCDLALGPLIFSPGRHDSGVVDRDAGDLVHAFALDVRSLIDVTRQMALRTGRREGARNCE